MADEQETNRIYSKSHRHPKTGSPLSPMNQNQDLARTIIEFLKQGKPQTAFQISKHIGSCDKKTVNQVLYRLQKEGILTFNRQGAKPLWSVVNPEAVAAPYRQNEGCHRHPSGFQSNYYPPSKGQQQGSPNFRGNFRQQFNPTSTSQPTNYLHPQPYHPYRQPPYHQPPYHQPPHHQPPQHQPPHQGPHQGPRGRGGGGRGRGRGRGRENSFSGHEQGSRYPPRGASNSSRRVNGEFPGDRANLGAVGPSVPGYSRASANTASTPSSSSQHSAYSGQKESSSKNVIEAQMSALNSALTSSTVTIQSSTSAVASSKPNTSDKVSDTAVDSKNITSHLSAKAGESAVSESSSSLDQRVLKEERKADEEGDYNYDEMEVCYNEDDGSNFSERFQDMMGPLMFSEDMEIDDPGVISDLILLELDSASGHAMTIGDLVVALKSTQEQLNTALVACGDKVALNKDVCTLTSSGRAAIEELQSSGGQFAPQQGYGSQPRAPPSFSGPPPTEEDSLLYAPSAMSSSLLSQKKGDNPTPVLGPPLPPKQWLESNSTLFPVGPCMEKTTAVSSLSSSRSGMDTDPSTALLSLQHARERGRGRGVLPAITGEGRPGKQPAPDKTRSDGVSPTVAGCFDVRDMEAKYLSAEAGSCRSTSQTSQSGSGANSSKTTSNSSDGSSKNKAFSGVFNIENIPWKPLPVNRPQSVSQLSLVQSSPQSSLIGQNVQGSVVGSSESLSKPAESLPLPASSQSQMIGAEGHTTSPRTSVLVPAAAAAASSQGALLSSPAALHPSLRKFASEGLTVRFNTGVQEKITAGSGSEVPFRPPLSPMELIEQAMGRTGLAPRSSGLSLGKNHQQPPFSTAAGPSSLTSLPSHNARPQMSDMSLYPASLPASGSVMCEREEAGGGGPSLQITAESFAALNKNPISALMEYAQSRHTTATIDVVGQRGPSHRPVFMMAATVGSRQFPIITCYNKKDGKKEAADVALKTLIAEGQMTASTPSPADSVAPENMTHFDRIAALTHQAFNTLIAAIPENLAGRKVIAGLVMKQGPEDLGAVISLGTGNRCITGDKLSLEGNTVNDSHAEVITRRGFMRFLYQQLLQYKKGSPHLLFEPGSEGRLRVKKNVTFHLYISTAPCGDGALFSPRDTDSNSGPMENWDKREHHPTFASNVQGLLRTKMEGGEGTIPVDSKVLTLQTWDGMVRGERLRTMSCTDKICRWNVLGLQGALLSHFLEPIYLDSLTLGFLYDHGHLSRAVCCRLARQEPSLDTELPPGYRLNHPWLGRVTACQPLRETQKTKAYSINWVIGDSAPEVLDGTLGICYTVVEKKLFSRVSKRQLYDSFKETAKHLDHSDLCQAKSYHQAKAIAAPFQASKAAMFSKFQQMGCGWVKKPVEEEMFS